MADTATPRPKVVKMEPVAQHTMVMHTNDRLSIVDEDGQHCVAARRVDGVWHISADGVDDTHTTGLHEHEDGVIKKMTDHMVLHKHGTLDHEGFSTWVPHEIRKLHGKESHDDWKTRVGLHHLTFF